MERTDNLIGVLATLYQWRKAILGLSVAAAIGTGIISLFLPNYYKSTTVFLAANPDQARPEILFGKAGTYLYGGGNDIDRLLTIAESNELVDALVDTFNLYEHYRINEKSPIASETVRKKFLSLYSVSKTKRDAIELTVEDRDPKLAANIANVARELINNISQEVIKVGQRKTIASYEASINQKIIQMNHMGDSLIQLRNKYKIYNTLEMSAVLTQRFSAVQGAYFRNKGRLESMRKNPRIPRDSVAFAEAMVSGYKTEVDSLTKILFNFNIGQVNLIQLETQYFSSNGVVGDEMERVRLLRSALQSQVPAIYVLEPAEPPVVKSRPKRAILVVIAGIIAFFIAVIGVLLFDTYKNADWRASFHAD
jgi:uncharacterized protein involved in exopolysaccharide biosynthesis